MSDESEDPMICRICKELFSETRPAVVVSTRFRILRPSRVHLVPVDHPHGHAMDVQLIVQFHLWLLPL